MLFTSRLNENTQYEPFKSSKKLIFVEKNKNCQMHKTGGTAYGLEISGLYLWQNIFCTFPAWNRSTGTTFSPLTHSPQQSVIARGLTHWLNQLVQLPLSFPKNSKGGNLYNTVERKP